MDYEEYIYDHQYTEYTGKKYHKLNQKAKVRREQKLFIAEGRKMFMEAPDQWIEKVYVSEHILEDQELMEKVRNWMEDLWFLISRQRVSHL